MDSAPTQTYSILIEQLNSLQLAYLHLIEPRVHYNFDVKTVDTHFKDLRALCEIFQGPIIAAGELYADLQSSASVKRQGRPGCACQVQPLHQLLLCFRRL